MPDTSQAPSEVLGSSFDRNTHAQVIKNTSGWLRNADEVVLLFYSIFKLYCIVLTYNNFAYSWGTK